MAAAKKNEIGVDLYAPFARWRTDLLRIETRCFGAHGDDDEGLEDSIKKALFVAVIHQGDKAIGYCLTTRLWPETAYVATVAIDPDFQGKGHLGTLLAPVEAEFRTIGFTHFEINARLATLADKIAKHYADRIEVSYDHGSNIGPLRFFRIALKEPPLKGAPPTGEQQKEGAAE